MNPGDKSAFCGESPPGAVSRPEFECDTQNIIISLLRFSMKDVSENEIFGYALSRILSASLMPFTGRGCIFTADEEKESMSVAAEKGLSAAQKKQCSHVGFRDCACAATAGSGRPRVIKCPLEKKNPCCCVPLVYRGSLLGVMVFFLGRREFLVSEQEEDFLTGAANALAGVLARKKAEREAARIRAELQSARRLADIGALSASVAHELRSPLAVIKMAAGNMRRKTGDPSLEKHLSNIEIKVAECDRIIGNLLFYAKLKKPQVEKARLYDIILESIRDSRKSSGVKGVSLRKNLSPVKDVYLNVDPVQIKEVFTNIMANAFESLDAGGGSVRISSRVEKDGRTVIIINDTGRGMAPDNIGKIFSPFFTTKARGNGLGLTVADRIVRMHGGRIEVESREGGGSSFRVSLPAGPVKN